MLKNVVFKDALQSLLHYSLGVSMLSYTWLRLTRITDWENSESTKTERYLFFHNRGLFTLQISHQQQAPANKGAKKLNTYSG